DLAPSDRVELGRLTDLGQATDPDISVAVRLGITWWVAALMLLRWWEQEDAERAAEAAFDERPYEPTIPPELGWSVWSSQGWPARDTFLKEKLLPWMRRGGRGPMARQLTRPEPVLSSFSKIEGVTVPESILDVLKPLNFEDSSSRAQAQGLLERLVTWT